MAKQTANNLKNEVGHAKEMLTSAYQRFSTVQTQELQQELHEEVANLDKQCKYRLNITNAVDFQNGSEVASISTGGVYRSFKHYFKDNDDHIKKQLHKFNEFMKEAEPELLDLKGLDDVVK